MIVKSITPSPPKNRYNDVMGKFKDRLGVLPILLLGSGLFVIGLLAIAHIVNNWWPFDVSRLDLVRATALDRADPTSLLEAANGEIILAFLALILVTITGLALPLAYILNRRGLRRSQLLGRSETPPFLLVLRQAMWVGLWVAFCIWLQMNRVLGVAIAGLVAVVFIMFEALLQVRTRAGEMNG
ncbi:MAG: hypothetical protein GY803_20840 [Chloroflexi bacterium]|nr:hypothetical protein [Chloroflexota bacterium]